MEPLAFPIETASFDLPGGDLVLELGEPVYQYVRTGLRPGQIGALTWYPGSLESTPLLIVEVRERAVVVKGYGRAVRSIAHRGPRADGSHWPYFIRPMQAKVRL